MKMMMLMEVHTVRAIDMVMWVRGVHVPTFWNGGVLVQARVRVVEVATP